jgi:hypothetical protein
MQPIVLDEYGVPRFKANPIVRYLLDRGPFDMNHLAAVGAPMGWSDDDAAQFAQLIGYSTSGWGSLSYVAPRAAGVADRRAAKLIAVEDVA